MGTAIGPLRITRGTLATVNALPAVKPGRLIGSILDPDAAKRRVFVEMADGSRKGLAWEGEGADGESVPGPAGDPGADGADGQNGADGQDGASAYDLWLAAGNTGTLDDFLNRGRKVFDLPAGDSTLYLPINNNSIQRVTLDVRPASTGISKAVISKQCRWFWAFFNNNSGTENISVITEMRNEPLFYLSTNNIEKEQSLTTLSFSIIDNLLKLSMYQAEGTNDDNSTNAEQLLALCFIELQASDYTNGLPITLTNLAPSVLVQEVLR